MKIQNLNRLNDALFKDIFGKNPEITLDFINSVFEYEGTPTFQSVDFIDRELDPVEEDGKESRLDLLGMEKSTGAKVNIEVQVATQEYFGKRSLYYWARLYDRLKRGDDYDDLKRAVVINLLDFVLFDDEKEASNWHSCFGIYDKKTGKQLTKDLEMHFIELPKWKIYKEIKKMNSLECWTSYFDKKTQIKELEEIAMQAPMVKEAIKRECIFTQDEIRQRAYELKEKAERDKRAQMKYAIKQGMKQGMEQGMKQGMETEREQTNLLIQHLLSEGKTNELLAVTTDESLRQKLLKEYNIL